VRGGASLVVVMTIQRAANFILTQASTWACMAIPTARPSDVRPASGSCCFAMSTRRSSAWHRSRSICSLTRPSSSRGMEGHASGPGLATEHPTPLPYREGIRLTLGRVILANVPSETEEFRRFMNLAWLPVLLGPLTSLLCVALAPSGGQSRAMAQAGYLFALAASLESLSEPLYLTCQSCLLTSARAFSEGVATLVRSLVTFTALVVLLPPERAIVAFGLAQVPTPPWAPVPSDPSSRTFGLVAGGVLAVAPELLLRVHPNPVATRRGHPPGAVAAPAAPRRRCRGGERPGRAELGRPVPSAARRRPHGPVGELHGGCRLSWYGQTGLSVGLGQVGDDP
jgi:hypothetical protein